MLLFWQKPRIVYILVPLFPALCIPTVCKVTNKGAGTVSPSAKARLQAGTAGENRLQPRKGVGGTFGAEQEKTCKLPP